MIPLGPVVARSRVRAPRAAVWATVIDPELRQTWWPELHLEPRLGGAVAERWTETSGDSAVTRDASGDVDVWVEGHAIGFRWSEAGDDHSTAVLVTLRSQGPETGITVTETGFDVLPSPAERAAASQDGWQVLLADLVASVEAAVAAGSFATTDADTPADASTEISPDPEEPADVSVESEADGEGEGETEPEADAEAEAAAEPEAEPEVETAAGADAEEVVDVEHSLNETVEIERLVVGEDPEASETAPDDSESSETDVDAAAATEATESEEAESEGSESDDSESDDLESEGSAELKVADSPDDSNDSDDPEEPEEPDFDTLIRGSQPK